MGMALQLFAVDEESLRDAINGKHEEPKRRLFGLLPGNAELGSTANIDHFLDQLFEFDLDTPNPDSADLDKAWDVIRVALDIMHSKEQVVKAATEAVLGTRNAEGGPMGGFGWVPKDEVGTIAEALNKVSLSDFDAALNHIPNDAYLASVLDDEDDGKEYFSENFQGLSKFYNHAKKSKKAVMLVIC